MIGDQKYKKYLQSFLFTFYTTFMTVVKHKEAKGQTNIYIGVEKNK